MLNYLAMMGWTMPDGREEFSLDEFVAAFSLEDISLGGPVFDLDKLTWLNGKYIRQLQPDQLVDRLSAGLLSTDYLRRIAPLVHERINTLEEFIDYAGFFFVGSVPYDAKAANKLVAKQHTPPETAKALRILLEEHLDGILQWNAESIETAAREYCEASGWTPKQLFMPIRIAVTGKAATPPLFDTMEVLGKEVCRRRLHDAITLLRTMKP